MGHSNEERTDSTRRCHRDVELAVRGVDGIDGDAVRRAASEREPSLVTIPDDHDSTVFEVVGMDCPTCAALAEAALESVDGTSSASATHRTNTIRVSYDPRVTDATALAARLADAGYPVESRDRAFADRRKRQWADARLATGVLAGSMILLPYLAVVYPSRLHGLFYTAAGGAYLAELLASPAGTHFYINLAVLSAIVVGFTGKPILDRAIDGLRRGTPNGSLAIAAAAGVVYAYSTLAAFVVGGAVYYDLAVGIVVAAAIARRVGVTATQPTSESTPTPAEDDPERANDAGAN